MEKEERGSMRLEMVDLPAELLIQMCKFFDVLKRDDYEALLVLWEQEIMMKLAQVKISLYNAFFGRPRYSMGVRDHCEAFDFSITCLVPRVQLYTCRPLAWLKETLFWSDMELLSLHGAHALIVRIMAKQRFRWLFLRGCFTQQLLKKAFRDRNQDMASRILTLIYASGEYQGRDHPLEALMRDGATECLEWPCMQQFLIDKATNTTLLFDMLEESSEMDCNMVEKVSAMSAPNEKRLAELVNERDEEDEDISKSNTWGNLYRIMARGWKWVPLSVYDRICLSPNCAEMLIGLDSHKMLDGKIHPLSMVHSPRDVLLLLKHPWKSSFAESEMDPLYEKFMKCV